MQSLTLFKGYKETLGFKPYEPITASENDSVMASCPSWVGCGGQSITNVKPFKTPHKGDGSDNTSSFD